MNKATAVTHVLLLSHSISYLFIICHWFASFLLLESSFMVGVSKTSPRKSLCGDSPSRFILRGEKAHCYFSSQGLKVKLMDAHNEIVKEVLTSAEVAMRVDSSVKLPRFESWLCYFF